MQQTETYKLNLIERNDPFSPDALNQNTQKIEEVMRDKTDAADTTDIISRVVTLEKFHFAAGTYDGDSVANRVIELGFTPTALLMWGNSESRHLIVVENFTYAEGSVKIIPGGFMLVDKYEHAFNYRYLHYCYIAFGIDK